MMKKNIYIAMTVLILISFIVIIFNYKQDPFQIYNQDKFFIKGDERFSNIGLAKHQKFDSIILGTSMSENFDLSSLNEKFNGEFLSLTMRGSKLYEQILLLKLALNNNKNIKRVILDLNDDAILAKKDEIHEFYTMPLYLYDKNYINDLKYLLNIDTLDKSLRKIIQKKSKAGIYQKDPYKIKGWFNGSKKEFPLKYKQMPTSVLDYSSKVDDYKDNLDSNLFEIVKQYNDIQFIFYFPPYSILEHYVNNVRMQQKLQDFLYIKEYIVVNALKYKNIKIYDFQVDDEIIFDKAFYKDRKHFHPMINKKIAEAISSNNPLYLIDDNLKIQNNNKKLLFMLSKLDHIDPYHKNMHTSSEFINKKSDKNQARKFIYGISNNIVQDDKLLLRGWALNIKKIDEVVLKINKSGIKTTNFHNRIDVAKKYPQYKENKIGFIFEDIPIDKNTKEVTLEFKSKGKLIETKIVMIK